MLLQEIKRETIFTVTLNDKREFKVEYLGHTSPYEFEISSDDISNDINTLKGTLMDVQFFSKASVCNFTAEINRAKTKFKRFSPVICTAGSPIKVSPRRNTDRIGINVKVRVYSQIDGAADKLLYEGKSSDISIGGIRLFFHSQAELQPGSTYILEFRPHSTTFTLPAKVMQKQKIGSVHSNDYEYGFKFDTDNQDEYGESLIVDILKAQIKSGK